MKVSELMEALRCASPDAEVVSCIEVPDGEGDYLLFGEVPASGAEPYPGDGSRFLVRSSIALDELVSQACDASVVRNLASALEREADSMDEGIEGHDLDDDAM